MWHVVCSRCYVVGGRRQVVLVGIRCLVGRWQVEGGMLKVVDCVWKVVCGKWLMVGGSWYVVGGRW